MAGDYVSHFSREVCRLLPRQAKIVGEIDLLASKKYVRT